MAVMATKRSVRKPCIPDKIHNILRLVAMVAKAAIKEVRTRDLKTLKTSLPLYNEANTKRSNDTNGAHIKSPSSVFLRDQLDGSKADSRTYNMRTS